MTSSRNCSRKPTARPLSSANALSSYPSNSPQSGFARQVGDDRTNALPRSRASRRNGSSTGAGSFDPRRCRAAGTRRTAGGRDLPRTPARFPVQRRSRPSVSLPQPRVKPPPRLRCLSRQTNEDMRVPGASVSAMSLCTNSGMQACRWRQPTSQSASGATAATGLDYGSFCAAVRPADTRSCNNGNVRGRSGMTPDDLRSGRRLRGANLAHYRIEVNLG